jgi:hypothetical protein
MAERMVVRNDLRDIVHSEGGKYSILFQAGQGGGRTDGGAFSPPVS